MTEPTKPKRQKAVLARTDAEKAARRTAITQAARTLMLERGLAVTLDDVAEKVGIGKGTVCMYLPDGKRELEDQVRDAILAEPIPEDALRLTARILLFLELGMRDRSKVFDFVLNNLVQEEKVAVLAFLSALAKVPVQKSTDAAA